MGAPAPLNRRARWPNSQALIKGLEKLVETDALSMAARYKRTLSVGDLKGVGGIGLVEAAQTYDPALGVPFERFARKRINGAMLNAIREERPHLRALVAGSEAIDDFPEDPHDNGDPLRDTEKDSQARLHDYTDGAAAALFAGFTLAASLGGEQALVARETTARMKQMLDAAIAGLSERDQKLVRLRNIEASISQRSLSSSASATRRSAAREPAHAARETDEARTRRRAERHDQHAPGALAGARRVGRRALKRDDARIAGVLRNSVTHVSIRKMDGLVDFVSNAPPKFGLVGRKH